MIAWHTQAVSWINVLRKLMRDEYTVSRPSKCQPPIRKQDSSLHHLA